MTKEWTTRNTLLLRAKDPDDTLAWDDFCTYYRRFVRIVLEHLNAPQQHLDDIIQECLLRIWGEYPNLDYDPQRARFRTWLSTVIRNTMINYINKQKRIKDKHDKYSEENVTVCKDMVESDFAAVVEKEWQVYVANLALERVRTKFSGKAIEAFEMLVKGATIEEIAQELELAVSSVYKLTGRVRDQLVKEIQELEREL